jgi:hypothetical protein
MGTTQMTIVGKASWAKVFEENRDKRGFEDAFVPFDGAYTIDVTMNKAEFDRLAATGAAKASKIKQKEVDKFGETNLKFTRKHQDRFEWSSGAPSVVKPDGTPWIFGRDGVIPNGSTVAVNIDVYTTSKATGTRLVNVHVIEVADMEEKSAPTPTKGSPAPEEEGVLF